MHKGCSSCTSHGANTILWIIIKHIIAREDSKWMWCNPYQYYHIPKQMVERTQIKRISVNTVLFSLKTTPRDMSWLYILFKIWIICFKKTRHTGASMSNKSKLFIDRTSISHFRMKKTISVRVVQHSRTLLRGWWANCIIKLRLFYSNSNCSDKWN